MFSCCGNTIKYYKSISWCTKSSPQGRDFISSTSEYSMFKLFSGQIWTEWELSFFLFLSQKSSFCNFSPLSTANSVWFQPSLRGQLAEKQDQQLRECFLEYSWQKKVEVMAAMVSVHNSLSETPHKPGVASH